MAFSQGVSPILTTPSKICEPSVPGFVNLQAIGTALITIGGPNVIAGQGPTLPPGTNTVPGAITQFPVVHYGEFDNTTDAIYGIVSAGSFNAAWILPA